MGISHYSLDILMTKTPIKKKKKTHMSKKLICHYASKWSSSNLSESVLGAHCLENTCQRLKLIHNHVLEEEEKTLLLWSLL